jgi:kinesin family protein 15
VKCTYVEIYNEQIFDLLSQSQTKLQIREDRGVTFLENCTESHARNLKEVQEIISKGVDNRHVASTSMNLESSRSHAVFTAFIKTVATHHDSKKVVRTSRFHIVDLAGSERVKDTNVDGQRFKELCKINTSLSTLGKVIYELAENSNFEGSKKQQSFINFRTSKLTHLLKDSLGGNSKTVMICTLNPHMSAIKETLNTLKFAQRAKMIKQKPVVNEENNNAEYWKNKYSDLLKKL